MGIRPKPRSKKFDKIPAVAKTFGFAYRWATRFIAMDKAEAEKVLGKKRRHWFAKRKSIGAVLRDPSFSSPVRAAFFENEKDGTGVMVWNRAKAS